jgi:hypothetical protein
LRWNDSLLFGTYRLIAHFCVAWRRDLESGDNLNKNLGGEFGFASTVSPFVHANSLISFIFD